MDRRGGDPVGYLRHGAGNAARHAKDSGRCCIGTSALRLIMPERCWKILEKLQKRAFTDAAPSAAGSCGWPAADRESPAPAPPRPADMWRCPRLPCRTGRRKCGSRPSPAGCPPAEAPPAPWNFRSCLSFS